MNVYVSLVWKKILLIQSMINMLLIEVIIVHFKIRFKLGDLVHFPNMSIMSIII